MNIFAKFKETVSSVLPIMVMVLLLGLTIAPMSFGTMTRFVIGGVLVIFGLTIFLLGVDIGILPIGERLLWPSRMFRFLPTRCGESPRM